MENTNTWIKCENRLPLDNIVVETKSPGGIIQKLKRSGNLWFLSDGSMYVYYTPIEWRNI